MRVFNFLNLSYNIKKEVITSDVILNRSGRVDLFSYKELQITATLAATGFDFFAI